MTGKAQWIKEIAEEIGCSQASLKRAIKNISKPINSKYDILLSYAEWSVPKLKNTGRPEALYQRRIRDLENLIGDFKRVTEKMKHEFGEQVARKDDLIETQNQIIADRDRTIADQARIIGELKTLLRSLPLASGG
ncbi:MAG: hypothetical protein HC838_03340 [Spirulinaceae cyanobacterium RM2_2_10]|nr:hypothetical protein [Spirulinaceae cyanobacterium SM2_1_0]NJO19288.1 hypothetical protein [Spirulinaceae cyanobacterium RM2_2_10]